MEQLTLLPPDEDEAPEGWISDKGLKRKGGRYLARVALMANEKSKTKRKRINKMSESKMLDMYRKERSK